MVKIFRTVAFVAVVAALLLVALQLVQPLASAMRFRMLADDDEAPIIVRNGSMDILPGENWKWKQEDDGNGAPEAFSYQPTGFHLDLFDNHLWVNISANQMTCTPANPAMPIHAANIKVTFQDGTQPYTSTFLRMRRAINSRTNVKPANGLAFATGADWLRHGTPGNGFISEVTAEGLGTPTTCTFGSAADLKEIRICASAKRCQ